MTDEQPKQIPSQGKPRSSKPALALSGIALVVTIAVAGYGWTLLEKTQQQLTLVTARAGDLEKQLNDAKMQSSKTSAQLNQSIHQTEAELGKNIEKTKSVLTQLQANNQQLNQRLNELNIHDLNQWRLYEAQYLIHLAARKAWLESDMQSAISLLQSADRSVVGLKDPSLIPLRRAISDDINQLDALPQVDIEGVVIKLDSLRSQLDDLSLTQIDLPQASDDGAPQEANSGWIASLKASWHRFIDQFVTVRRRESKVEPLLEPKRAWYLKQNLQLQLQQAALAADRRQDDLYQQSLQQAIAWINRYFTHNPQAQHLVRALTELSEQSVTAVSLKQLRAVSLIDETIANLGKTTSKAQGDIQ